MAKGQRKETNRIIDETRNRDRDISQSELEHNRALRDQAQGRLNETYGGTKDVYDLMASGGLSPEDLARLRERMNATYQDSGGGGGGGFNPEIYQRDWTRYAPIEAKLKGAMEGRTVDTDRLRAGQGTFREMMNTGGFDRNQLYSIGNDLGMLQGMGYTGGLDPYSMDRMRGGGVFDEFAQTGGFDPNIMLNSKARGVFNEFSDTGGLSERDRSLLRDRATSPIASNLSSTKREINRLGRVQGGNSGARIAALARADRGSAQAASRASRDAELDVLDRTMSGRQWGAENLNRGDFDILDRNLQGRQWGAGNLASSEHGLQGLKTSNMMNAIRSALDFQSGFGGQLADRKLQAAGMLGQSELPIQNLLTSEGRWGTEGLSDYLRFQDEDAQRMVNERNAAGASSAAASRSAAADAERRARMALGDEWDIINFQNQNRLAGGQGLGNLYDSNVGQVMGYSDMFNNLRRTDQSGNATNIDQRMRNNPSFMEQFGPLIGAGVGAASSLFMPSSNRLRRPNYNYSDQYYGG